MAGTVALHAADPGFRFILIHATDGGRGEIRVGFPATRESLGRIRRREGEEGWRALGRSPDRHEWLELAGEEAGSAAITMKESLRRPPSRRAAKAG